MWMNICVWVSAQEDKCACTFEVAWDRNSGSHTCKENILVNESNPKT